MCVVSHTYKREEGATPMQRINSRTNWFRPTARMDEAPAHSGCVSSPQKQEEVVQVSGGF